MKISPLNARAEGLEVWAVAYCSKLRLFPRKVHRISKKFFYFDENDIKDRIEHYEFKDTTSHASFTTETEAWTFIARKIQPNLDKAYQLINDYKFITVEYPQALI